MNKHEIIIQNVKESVSEKNGKTYYNLQVMTEVEREIPRSKFMSKAQASVLGGGGEDFGPQQRWAFFNVCEDEVNQAPEVGDDLGEILGKDLSIFTVHLLESEYKALDESDAIAFSEYRHGGTLEPMTKDGEAVYKANFVEYTEDAEDYLIKCDKQEVEEAPKAKEAVRRAKA